MSLKVHKSREDVKAMRSNYLKWVSSYRKKGYRICYQGETRAFKNMNCTKIWKGLAAGAMESDYRVYDGKRDLFIVSHVGVLNWVYWKILCPLFRVSKSNKS